MPRALDIIVPVYRNAELTKACVDSILKHWGEIAGRRPRLLLINDSPDDAEVVALLQSLAAGRDNVSVMTNDTNLGFVQTVNRGLALARQAGHDVLLVNSDTVTFAGTLSELLRAAEADPQVGFASPRSNNASICSLPHFHGGAPATPEEAHRRWSILSATMPPWHFVPTAVGFYMFIDHRVLANHRGLRTHFGVGYEEENDLVMRAGKTGMRVIMVNRAFAYHAGSASFSLTDIDLEEHRNANHLKMLADHPEFLPLVRRYEASAHFRAERLMQGLLPDAKGRLRVCFDLSSMGQHHNGTNEHITSVLKALVPRWSDRIAFTGIATEPSFSFHGLDRVEGLARADPGDAGVHGVAIRMSQPFDLHHLNVLDGLAPINIYAMLDTIAEDSGPLAQDGGFIELWDFVAEHANGFLYNSRFTAREFVMRHSAAASRPSLAMLLSTRVEEYPAGRGEAAASGHVLVLGNHFPHKASDEAGRRLAAAFPNLRIVVLGANDVQSGNLQVIRPGTISADRMRELYAAASVVVLPSHLEGFGLGLMHALAAGKPIAARNIPATREILDCLVGVQGVELFDSDPAVAGAVSRALAAERSQVSGSSGPGWREWADGVGEMCLQLARSDDVFARLVKRLYVGDLLRQSHAYRSSEGMPALIQERSQLRRRMHVPLLGYAKLDSADSTQDPDGWLGDHLYVELLLYRPVFAVVLRGWRHDDEATRLEVRLQCGDESVVEQCGGGGFALELRFPVPQRDHMELRVNSQTRKAAAPDKRQISFILEHIELIHEST
jgi:GT2 family glycosyltransferase/glycosyltransferase involved in cell wall biosynthesis